MTISPNPTLARLCRPSSSANTVTRSSSLGQIEDDLKGREVPSDDPQPLTLIKNGGAALCSSATLSKPLMTPVGASATRTPNRTNEVTPHDAAHRGLGHPLPRPHEQVPGEERLLDPGPAAVAQLLDADLGGQSTS